MPRDAPVTSATRPERSIIVEAVTAGVGVRRSSASSSPVGLSDAHDRHAAIDLPDQAGEHRARTELDESGSTPSCSSRVTTSSHRTGDDTWRISASTASAAVRFGSASTLRDDRNRGSLTASAADRRQPVLRRLHQRAVERRAHRQRNRRRFAPTPCAPARRRARPRRHDRRSPPAPGALRFAGDTTRPASSRAAVVARRLAPPPRPGRGWRPSRPPPPARPPACTRPRRRTVVRASAKDNVPAATCAAYSPRLWPAANDACTPRDATSRQAATLTARIAGCVYLGQLQAFGGTVETERAERLARAPRPLPRTSRGTPRTVAASVAAHAHLLGALTGKYECDHDVRAPRDRRRCDRRARDCRRAPARRTAPPCARRC